MSVTYDAYYATLTGTKVAIEAVAATGLHLTGASSKGNSAAILGDVAGDRFTGNFTGSAAYDGSVTFANGTQGFLSTYRGEQVLLLVHGTKPPERTGNFHHDVPGAKGTEFDLKTGMIGCFLAGTQVATPNGPARIEALRPGDLVVTADGAAEPVRWVGRRVVARQFADPVKLLPIRVCAGAVGDGLPHNDVLVSPCHALLVDGVLIQAGALVNGQSVVRCDDAPETFTYYHIELSSHALVLVEGVPAETFIDNVDRMAFDNWAEHEDAACGATPLVEMAYPRAKSARQVPRATRNRLAVIAAGLSPPAIAA